MWSIVLRGWLLEIEEGGPAEERIRSSVLFVLISKKPEQSQWHLDFLKFQFLCIFDFV